MVAFLILYGITTLLTALAAIVTWPHIDDSGISLFDEIKEGIDVLVVVIVVCLLWPLTYACGIVLWAKGMCTLETNH